MLNGARRLLTPTQRTDVEPSLSVQATYLIFRQNVQLFKNVGNYTSHVVSIVCNVDQIQCLTKPFTCVSHPPKFIHNSMGTVPIDLKLKDRLGVHVYYTCTVLFWYRNSCVSLM
jgi:hypothetical protein